MLTEARGQTQASGAVIAGALGQAFRIAEQAEINNSKQANLKGWPTSGPPATSPERECTAVGGDCRIRWSQNSASKYLFAQDVGVAAVVG
jgi:hypothetical protein